MVKHGHAENTYVYFCFSELEAYGLNAHERDAVKRHEQNQQIMGYSCIRTIENLMRVSLSKLSCAISQGGNIPYGSVEADGNEVT